MTEPLPCPFCGHVGLSHNEGSTFRWLSTECNGCGAQCGEERINTMTMERSAAIEQAKVAAIKTWNTRFTPLPPQQQAEPVACPIGLDKKGASQFCSAGYCATCKQQQAEPVAMRMPRVGDRVICLEDESLGEVVSLTAGGSPDIKFDDGTHGTYMLREFAKLFGYVTPPQRQWVGLTDKDFLEACQLAERGNYLIAFQRIQIKLKECNT